MQNLTIEDLKFTRFGHSIPSGSHNWHGRMIQDHEFVEIYKTKIGDFSPAEWNDLALQVVKDTGKYDLYLAVMEHCRKNCAWLHKEAEINELALDCMTNHAYEAWKDEGLSEILCRE